MPRRFCLTISKELYPEYNSAARQLCAMHPVARVLTRRGRRLRRRLREMWPRARWILGVTGA